MFSNPIKRGQALCVPLFYGIMEAVVLGIYCIVAWKAGWSKAPRDENFCVMIAKTYEVEEDEGLNYEQLLDGESATEAEAGEPADLKVNPIV